MLRKAKVCALDQLLLERFGGKVAGAWQSDRHDAVTIPDVWNLYLPRSSRTAMYTVEMVNPQPKRGIMKVQTLVCSRRPCC